MMPTDLAPLSSPNAERQRRYGELAIYPVVFLALIICVFLLNLVLAAQSQRDAEHVFCAIQQQKAWVSTRRSVEDAQISASISRASQPAIAAFTASFRTLDRITTAFYNSDTVNLDGQVYRLDGAQDARTRKSTQQLYEILVEGRGIFDTCSAPTEVSDGLNRALEFVLTQDAAAMSASQTFILALGELSQERTARLQTFQVISLALSAVTFIAMVVRVIYKLRKQDKIIDERTDQLIAQRDMLEQEKAHIERLVKDLQTTQSQLIQAEKMSSLGQMVAGLAHEVNSPLGFVRNNIELFQRNYGILSSALQEHDTLRDYLERGSLEQLEPQVDLAKSSMSLIEEYDLIGSTSQLVSDSLAGIDRIQDLVINLKNFSRLDEATAKFADINDGIDAALMIADNVIKHKATVKKHYGDGVRAQCYPAQLNQVFLNLLTNAAQAIPDGQRGTITITTQKLDEHVIITIADDGIGIAPEHLNKIFEPFFTTKPVGQGTGLGLSIVYKIIENHNGVISVQSTLGKGTEFMIRLPIQRCLKSDIFVT